MPEVYLLIEDNYCSCMQDVELLACDHINTTIRGAFETIQAAARCLSNLGSREVDRWECVPPDDLRSCDHEVAAREGVRCAGGPSSVSVSRYAYCQ